ncbi:MAG: zf-HC2 domain-containing protein [Vicinamibacterales bacterium]
MSALRRPSARCRALLQELSQYLDGELAPTRCRAIERHIKTCACCGTLAGRLRQTVAVCRALQKTSLPSDVRSRAAARIRALLAETSTKGEAS